MATPISTIELERIRATAAAGKKIEAIKLYRAASGAGLAEAKAAVEALAAGRPIDVADPMGAVSKGDIDAIEAAVFAGETIQAIRLYRGATGEGLKEAKDFIEALEAELRRTEPMRFTAPKKKSGCGVSVLALLVSLAFVIARLLRAN